MFNYLKNKLLTRYWILIIFGFVFFLYLLENKFCIESILMFNHIYDYSVALGTILLAFFTWRLARITKSEGIKQRNTLIEEGRKERRRLRLKEQLEGLYAPLIANIKNFRDRMTPQIYGITFGEFLKEIKGKYEYLATPELIIQIRKYLSEYDTEFKSVPHWDNFITPLINQIQMDYEKLIAEYNSLF